MSLVTKDVNALCQVYKWCRGVSYIMFCMLYSLPDTTPKPRIVGFTLFLDRLLIRLGERIDNTCRVSTPDRHGGHDGSVGEYSPGEDLREVLDDSEFALRLSNLQQRLTIMAPSPISTPWPILAASTIASAPTCTKSDMRTG